MDEIYKRRQNFETWETILKPYLSLIYTATHDFDKLVFEFYLALTEFNDFDK